MSSWLQLSNKTAIITGAASGIGAAVAKALTYENLSNVILVDKDSSRLADLQQDCGPSFQSRICDVSQEDQVRSLFQSCPEESSILIQCAGITRDSWIGSMDLTTQWQQVLDVNLTGTFLCCREFLRQGERKFLNGGAIVNVSSVVALQGNMGQTNYAASKGGVLSLTKALAREVAHRNIRVNCVCPGFIETPMVESVPIKVQHRMQQKISLGRFGKPQDVANLILFLASCNRAGYITGESMECSGMISI
jgi:3-oxoacyl-[acyl-carrier protein] reductase